MFNRFLNRSKDYLTAIPGQEKKLITNLKGTVSCLLYHRIENYGEREFLDKGGSPVTSPEDFDKELSYIKTLPVEFYTLRDLHLGKFPDTRKIGIVICFDDCFRCNYNQGLDILSKHSIPAVFFQCSGFINQKTLIWEHALYWLFNHENFKFDVIKRSKQQLKVSHISKAEWLSKLREQTDPLIIEQIVAAIIKKSSLRDVFHDISKSIYPAAQDIISTANKGHEIASHGHHHYKRETISEDLFEQELLRSQSVITELTGFKPTSFSYPFNSFFPADHALVNKYYDNIATVDNQRLSQAIESASQLIPRLTWPGKSHNIYRMKRWILTGSF